MNSDLNTIGSEIVKSSSMERLYQSAMLLNLHGQHCLKCQHRGLAKCSVAVDMTAESNHFIQSELGFLDLWTESVTVGASA